MSAKSISHNVLVILGHGSNTSFSAAVADTYAKAAQAAGHTVRVLRLGVSGLVGQCARAVEGFSGPRLHVRLGLQVQ